MARERKKIIATDSCNDCKGHKTMGFVLGKDKKLYGTCSQCGSSRNMNATKSIEVIDNCIKCGIDIHQIYYQENNYHFEENHTEIKKDKEININGDHSTNNIE